MNVWKIASRWNDNGENDVEDKLLEDFIKYKIVFAGRKTDYIKKVEENDIIAISDGIVVKAIAKAIGKPKFLSEFGINDLEVYYKGDEQTMAISVDIYELDEEKYFEYNRGTFHKVAANEYYNKLISLFFGKREPFYITQFSISKYEAIEKIENMKVPNNTQWIFLTGENGYGKTTILKALAHGLYNNKTAEIYITLENSNRKIEVIPQYVEFENVIAYGAYRTKLHPASDNINPTDNLFGKSEYVLNFETRFKEMEGVPELKVEREKIIAILRQLVPNLSRIEVVRDDKSLSAKVLYSEKTENGNTYTAIEFNKLALGMRNIIGFVCDMVFRFTKYQKLDDGLFGIVLIDEFDNHLHPKWQRDLVKKLSYIFPKVQFIVSTHSPIPLLGAPPDRTVILNVNRTKEEGITVKRLEKLEKELKYLLPNQLLTSDIFGLEEIESVYLDDSEFDNVPIEDSYNDIEENKKMMQDLAELAKNTKLLPTDLFKNKNM